MIRSVYARGIVLIFLFLPITSFAYEPATTHAGLSQEMVDFYNAVFPNKLTDKEKELIIRGSIEEDHPNPRVLNHFYDPVRNIGINNGRTAKSWALDNNIESNDFSWPKSIAEYAKGNREQAFLGLGHVIHLIEDMSVPDHTRNDPHIGIGANGLFTGESPYESWTNKMKNRDTLKGLGKNLVGSEVEVYKFSTLGEYFDFLAKYSNENFFSQDTINANIFKYDKPEINSISGDYGYWFDVETKKEEKIIILNLNEDGTIEKKIFFEKDSSVVSSYFDRLSRQVIPAGAGVIDLFIREGELARIAYEDEYKRLHEESILEAERLSGVLSNKGVLGLILYGAGSFLADATNVVGDSAVDVGRKIATATRQVTQDVSALASIGTFSAKVVSTIAKEEIGKATDSAITFVQKNASNIFSPEIKRSLGAIAVVSAQSNINNRGIIDVIPNDPEIIPKSITPQSPNISPLPVPGFGGTGPNLNKEIVKITQQASLTSALDSSDKIPPTPPVISTPTPQDFSKPFTNSNIAFSGTSEVGVIISTDFSSATTSSDGSWVLPLSLSEGTTTINFYATDSSNNRSTGNKITVFVDSVAPIATFIINECIDSLSQNECLLTSPTITIIPDLSSPDIFKASLFIGTTTIDISTSTISILLNNQGIHDIYLKTEDHVGNIFTSSVQKVIYESNPVVINEIAWAGTSASSADEWIELYNRTDATINLGNFILHTDDNSPYIPLRGTINPKGYFLIERKNSADTDEMNESPVKDVTADMWVSFGFGLKNSGERILLSRFWNNGTTTIDEVPFCNDWCYAGEAVRYTTMERWRADKSGTERQNWRSALADLIHNGHDVSGGLIRGTPRARNGISHLIVTGRVLGEDRVLSAIDSPYLVESNDLEIPFGRTLRIEPGTVIKMQQNPDTEILVYGSIEGGRIGEAPITLTTFTDDSAGGDMNQDGICDISNASSTALCPTPGSWRAVSVFPGGTATLNNTEFRFGGGRNGPSDRTGNLSVFGGQVEIIGCKFSDSLSFGVYVSEDSDITIRDSKIYNNIATDYGGLLAYFPKSFLLADDLFENNSFGAHIYTREPITVERNTFLNNRGSALGVSGLISSVRNNIGSGNRYNAITLNGAVSTVGGTTTLSVNPLPYLVVGEARVVSDSALVLEQGVVIKGQSGNAYSLGTLIVSARARLEGQGNDQNSFIFTSVHDDSFGGDTDNSPSGTPTPADWRGIVVEPNATISLSGFTMRYAGSVERIPRLSLGAITINDGTSSLQNGVIEYNGSIGLAVTGGLASTTISGVTFRNHRLTPLGDASAGIEISESSITLNNPVFENNIIDIRGTSASSVFCTGCTAPIVIPPEIVK